jgi:hypothetical protein
MGGRADFSNNLGTSPFNKYLSNEPNFDRIHLAGQYLQLTKFVNMSFSSITETVVPCILDINSADFRAY